VLTAAFGPVVAAVTGLPLWAGVLVTAGVLYGVPVFAVRVVERVSPDRADRICEWHLAAAGLAVVALILAGVGALIWRCVAG
jgi:hypothetical protein